MQEHRSLQFALQRCDRGIRRAAETLRLTILVLGRKDSWPHLCRLLRHRAAQSEWPKKELAYSIRVGDLPVKAGDLLRDPEDQSNGKITTGL